MWPPLLGDPLSDIVGVRREVVVGGGWTAKAAAHCARNCRGRQRVRGALGWREKGPERKGEGSRQRVYIPGADVRLHAHQRPLPYFAGEKVAGK